MGSSRRRHTGHQTPLGAVLRGAIAGAIGTGAMDLIQYAEYRSGGGSENPTTWEFRAVEKWDGAPAPAEIGRRVAEGLLQRSLPDSDANLVNNLVHWGYGAAWGAAYGIVAGSRRSRGRGGLLFATVVWLAGYTVLPRTGLYQPINEYEATTLAKDWGHHAAFGVAAARAFGFLSP